MGTLGIVFESRPARERQSLHRFENSRNLASSLCEMEQDRRMRREVTILNPSQERVPGQLFHWKNLFSRLCDGLSEVIDVGNASWKIPGPREFQSWKVNFKIQVCASSQFLHVTMHWITEVR